VTGVALVTGAASGLGRATAVRLAADGMDVFGIDRDGGVAAVLAGGRHAVADVTDTAALAVAIGAAVGIGPIRAVVCCAGIGWAQRTLSRTGSPHDLDVFRKVLDVNVVGTFNVARLAAAAMARNEPVDGERGVIVCTASVAAWDGQVGQVAYAASKAAIAGMVLPMARDLSPAGIRVLGVAPGLFDTPLVSNLGPEARDALEAAIPFPPRLGRPEEFADLVAALIRNRYINGEVVRLDGGLRLPPR
jgi:NAD(P)-dependent dehydrogenase (short-subunit alcohol dehydrogenase family)